MKDEHFMGKWFRETVNPEFEFEMFALNLIQIDQVSILGYR